MGGPSSLARLWCSNGPGGCLTKTGLPLTDGALGKVTTPQKVIRRKTTQVDVQPSPARGLQTTLTRTHGKECICKTAWFSLHTHTHTNNDGQEMVQSPPRRALLTSGNAVCRKPPAVRPLGWVPAHLTRPTLPKVTPFSRQCSGPVIFWGVVGG